MLKFPEKINFLVQIHIRGEMMYTKNAFINFEVFLKKISRASNFLKKLKVFEKIRPKFSAKGRKI